MSPDQKEFEKDKLLNCQKRCEFPKGMEYKNGFAQALGTDDWWEFLFQDDKIVFEILETTFDKLKEKASFELIKREDSFNQRYLTYFIKQFIFEYFSEAELQ